MIGRDNQERGTNKPLLAALPSVFVVGKDRSKDR